MITMMMRMMLNTICDPSVNLAGQLQCHGVCRPRHRLPLRLVDDHGTKIIMYHRCVIAEFLFIDWRRDMISVGVFF